MACIFHSFGGEAIEILCALFGSSSGVMSEGPLTAARRFPIHIFHHLSGERGGWKSQRREEIDVRRAISRLLRGAAGV